jgi:hypothetical protein
MSEPTDPKADRRPDPAPRGMDEAKARLAAALKANMARRKAQARARASVSGDAPTTSKE